VTDNSAEAGPRYWAFISYSHRDAAFGRRLHRRLESYALPRRLTGRALEHGGLVPRRLAPIFRDREELAAAHNLSTEVRAALAQSRSLIVVCSPAAARSKWVGQEIEVFRELHPGRPILAAIREGEPAECFPAALRSGAGAEDAVEPLAADFRRGGEGEQLALLKLVAGVLGLGLDELVQRDAHRRTQRVMAVTAASLAAMVGMGVLTAYALSARAEAERQRNQAEGLVEFMLTDLRDRLKGVGRLDVMTAVNERALGYYGDQRLESLSVDSLERRARILHAMGEDDETRGDYRAAIAKLREASRTTAALLAQAPDDPQRVYDHAQSEYWIANADFEQLRTAEAREHFLAYNKLAKRLVALAPGNPSYRRELSYSEGNLCGAYLDKPVDIAAALAYCKRALADMEQLAQRLGRAAVARDLANRHAWLAQAYLDSGDLENSLAQRKLQESLLKPLLDTAPSDKFLQERWITLQRAYALLQARLGDKNGARTRFQQLLVKLDELIRFDPQNETWKSIRSHVVKELKALNQPYGGLQ